MTYEEFMNFAAALQSFATILSFIIGGIWVYTRYIRQRENTPNIESSAELNLIGEQAGWWIVELIATIENKGKVQHKMKEFRFDLNALCSDDQIDTSEKWGGQVNFPHLVAEGSLLPTQSDFFFIDPGIKAKYSYVARVPRDATFLIFHCWFKYYDDPNLSHTAEKSISVPRLKEKALS